MSAGLVELQQRATAIKSELERRRGTSSLINFTSYTFPEYEVNWHHRVVANHLDNVLTGEIRRLMVFMPPQNGKSELVSRRFPAYALGKDPNLRFIATSYSAGLAHDMSRDVQKVMDTRDYRVLFPEARLASGSDSEIRTSEQFDLVGRRGYYRSAGVLGGITGKSADIGLIDDPIKNRAEAESETYRKNVWDWYISTFATRQFGNTGRIIICLTRWHEDDLAGRLLRLAAEDPNADQWVVLSFPAIAEGELHPQDPREQGEALWPSKYPLSNLRARKASAGTYDWSALYQQRPVPPGGGMFQREWFETVGDLPRNEKFAFCRSWDCAGTEPVAGKDPDWTVGTLTARGITSEQYYIVDVIRVRKTAAKVDELIRVTATSDPAGTIIREEREGGSAGKSVINAHTKLLAGLDYEGVPATGAKTTRWRPFSVQCEAGNVKLLAGEWNRLWLDELTNVPYAQHDDQADSVALGFNTLSQLYLFQSQGQPVATPHLSLWHGDVHRTIAPNFLGTRDQSASRNPALGGDY